MATTRYRTTFTIRDAAASDIPPMSRDWPIKDAKLLNEGRRLQADLHAKDRSIDAIAGDLNTCRIDLALDASGLWLLPA